MAIDLSQLSPTGTLVIVLIVLILRRVRRVRIEL